MELIDSKDGIKNSKLVWLIAGILLMPLLNGIETLLGGVLKLLGVSVIPRLFISFSLQVIIVLSLLSLLVWIVKNWNSQKSSTSKLITLNNFRLYGFICLVVISAGRVTSYFVLTNLNKELELLDKSQRHDIMANLLNLQIASFAFTHTKEIIIFMIYFIIIYKNKTTAVISQQILPQTAIPNDSEPPA